MPNRGFVMVLLASWRLLRGLSAAAGLSTAMAAAEVGQTSDRRRGGKPCRPRRGAGLGSSRPTMAPSASWNICDSVPSSGRPLVCSSSALPLVLSASSPLSFSLCLPCFDGHSVPRESSVRGMLNLVALFFRRHSPVFHGHTRAIHRLGPLASAAANAKRIPQAMGVVLRLRRARCAAIV